MTQTITTKTAGRTVEITVSMQTERTISLDGDIAIVAVPIPTINVTVSVDGRSVACGYPEYRDGAYRLGKVQFTPERWAEIGAIIGTYKATPEYQRGQALCAEESRRGAAHRRTVAAMSVDETWR